MTVRGFILHPTYRVESGRPVVHLFGRLETGESFLVRDPATPNARALSEPLTSIPPICSP